MKKKKKSIYHLFSTAGIDENEYKTVAETIRYENGKMVVLLTTIAAFLYLFLFFASFVIRSMESNRLIYGIMFLISVAVFLLHQVVFRHRPKIQNSLIYVVLAITYSYAVFISWSTPDQLSITFLILLAGMPLFPMARPYKITLLSTVATVAFCVVAFCFKPHEIAVLDTINAVCVLVLSTTATVYIMKIKFSQLIAQKQVEKERDTDSLTKLYNKQAGQREVERLMKENNRGVLLFIDMDNFKYINDNYSHLYGDTVLTQVAQEVADYCENVGICARFGGDEFLIYVPGLTDRAYIAENAQHILENIQAHVKLPKSDVKVMASVGFALYPDDADTYSELLRLADVAMYESKRRGHCMVTSADECADHLNP